MLDVPPLMRNRELGMKMPDHEHDENEDLAPREHPLDLAAARERLGNRSGKEFWRSLEELSRDPHFEELLHREFPRHASEWSEADGVGRRDFLKLTAASLALAGISGCARTPNETILPYVKSPEGLTLGKPLYFAWFAGMAPAEDPKIVVVVMVPNVTFEGATSAGLATKIIAHFLRAKIANTIETTG